MFLKKMLFKDISYLESWRILCSADWNHFRNGGRRHHEVQYCEIILNLDQRVRRKYHLKAFLIWSSDNPFVQRTVTICAILVEDISWNNSAKLFLSLSQWFRRRCSLKISYLELWRSPCLVEQTHLCNFERGLHGEHSCEVI